MNDDYKKLWREKVKLYASPCFARTDTTLKPQDIDTHFVGYHVSMVFAQGYRHYLFGDQASRDRFVNKYRPHSAIACGNPCK